MHGTKTGLFTLQLDGVSSAGASSAPNGLVSRDCNGNALSCVNGVLKSPSVSDVVNTCGDIKCNNQNGTSLAYCP